MAPALDQLAGVASSTFIRLQADQVGPVIDDTLSQLVNLLDIECASLSVCAPGGTTFDVVHASARARAVTVEYRRSPRRAVVRAAASSGPAGRAGQRAR